MFDENEKKIPCDMFWGCEDPDEEKPSDENIWKQHKIFFIVFWSFIIKIYYINLFYRFFITWRKSSQSHWNAREIIFSLMLLKILKFIALEQLFCHNLSLETDRSNSVELTVLVYFRLCISLYLRLTYVKGIAKRPFSRTILLRGSRLICNVLLNWGFFAKLP